MLSRENALIHYHQGNVGREMYLCQRKQNTKGRSVGETQNIEENEEIVRNGRLPSKKYKEGSARLDPRERVLAIRGASCDEKSEKCEPVGREQRIKTHASSLRRLCRYVSKTGCRTERQAKVETDAEPC